MGIVLSACFTVGLIFLLFWLYSFYISYVKDRIELLKQFKEQKQIQEREQKERLLYQDGIMLHCMNCSTTFTGPLPDTGCPECHISSLVITEEEFNRSKLKNANGLD